MKIIYIFSHPDDETFSSGGTIAKLSRQGHIIKLITVTDGEAGELGDPPLTTQEKLGEVRTKELQCAADILGINEIFFLRFKDGQLNKTPLKTLKESILPLLQKEQPDIVVTFDKRGGSNHPDHIRTSKAVTQVYGDYQNFVTKHTRLYHTAMPRSFVKKISGTELEYKAFGKILGVPDHEITTSIDISDTFDLKIKAAMCHKTQIKDWQKIIKRTEHLEVKKEFFQLISENNL